MISSFYKDKMNITPVFVLDQTNLILGNPNLKEEIDFLKSIIDGYKVIVSASANNEIEELKIP
jgi:hypothetical protein